MLDEFGRAEQAATLDELLRTEQAAELRLLLLHHLSPGRESGRPHRTSPFYGSGTPNLQRMAPPHRAWSPPGCRRRAEVPGRHSLRVASVVATRCPEPPPSPAPGWVDAPMCQSRPPGVAWRPDEASGRHRKFWSSSAEPP